MLATLPGLQVDESRIGRKKAFMLGAIPLALSGVSGFLAVEHQHLQPWSLAILRWVYIAFATSTASRPPTICLRP